jgi:small subunit ribosomal protein S20
MAALAAQLGALSLGGARPCQRPRPVLLLAAPRLAARPLERGALVVTAAQNAERRERRIARETAYNRVYLDRIKSSSRAALKGYKELLADAQRLSSEADLQPVDQMMSKAFSWIDKAVIKGVLHKNTGARRKSKITNVRKSVLKASGLYPAA